MYVSCPTIGGPTVRQSRKGPTLGVKPVFCSERGPGAPSEITPGGIAERLPHRAGWAF